MRIIDADVARKKIVEWSDVFCNEQDAFFACDLIDSTPTLDPWHYPSRGEYPKKGEKVFCKDCFGEYNVAEYQGNSVDGEPPWLFNDKIDDYVLAWQYIIPPKEEA